MQKLKRSLFTIRSTFLAKITKWMMHLLMWTCKIKLTGLETFLELAGKEKCILMLWHNRLATVPFVLSRFTPEILYAALVSGSRDGDILSQVVHSYPKGKTIRVPHHGRYRALREFVRQIEDREHVVIITPDGPRGPLYEIKPGIAVAALETEAYVISLDWKAPRYWELKTWDRLRLPLPFSTITFYFGSPLQLKAMDLDQAKTILKENLPTD